MMMEKELGSTDCNQSSDDAVDEVLMNHTFRAILHEAHPAQTEPVIMRCVVGYMNHCVTRGTIVIDDTADRKVFTAEQCGKRSVKFLRYVNKQLAKWEKQLKVVTVDHEKAALKEGVKQLLDDSSSRYHAVTEILISTPSKANATACNASEKTESGSLGLHFGHGHGATVTYVMSSLYISLDTHNH